MGLCLDKIAMEYDIPFSGPGSSDRRFSARAAYCVSFSELSRRRQFFGAVRITNRDRPNGNGSVLKKSHGKKPCKLSSLPS